MGCTDPTFTPQTLILVPELKLHLQQGLADDTSLLFFFSLSNLNPTLWNNIWDGKRSHEAVNTNQFITLKKRVVLK